jgi:hypothetical protein
MTNLKIEDAAQLKVDDLESALARVDALFEASAVELAAGKIVESFRELVANPATPRGHNEPAGCIPLRLVRRSLGHQPRELFDAAVRWLLTLDEPPVEITNLSLPLPADLAEAVVAVVDGDVYLCDQLGLME